MWTYKGKKVFDSPKKEVKIPNPKTPTGCGTLGCGHKPYSCRPFSVGC